MITFLGWIFLIFLVIMVVVLGYKCYAYESLFESIYSDYDEDNYHIPSQVESKVRFLSIKGISITKFIREHVFEIID